MHQTCLHCTRDLGRNEVLETLPIGRRIAFDAAQGRLWVVCPHCAKWNLVPFDTRLETIDAAERLFRDTRTRFSTDNIGLARVREGLELVRIGEALRPEFAAWRYGESFSRRRRRSLVLGASAGAAVIGAVVGVGVGVAGLGLASIAGSWTIVEKAARAAALKRASVRVDDASGRGPTTLGFNQFERATIAWEEQEPVLDVAPFAMREKDLRTISWRGTELRSQGRKVVGGLNLLAGHRRELADAVELIAQHSGDLVPWLRDATTRQCRVGGANASWRYPGLSGVPHWRRYQAPYLVLSRLAPTERLAVEMWMNEDIERTWLEGELKLLEREWREAERLAKISDDLALEG